MKKRFIFLSTLLVICIHILPAQEKNDNPRASGSIAVFQGYLGMNVSAKAVYLTFGGPGLKYVKSRTAVFIGLLPAIRFSRTEIIPSVGGGLQLFHKNLAITCPSFYFTKGKWEVVAGVRFAFSKRK